MSWLLTVFFFVLFPSAALMGYLGRKLGADLQARVGPNRAGPAGFFQPAADLLKALQKEDAARTTPIFQQLCLAALVGLLFSTVTVLPLNSQYLVLNADLSIFLPLWAGLGVAMMSLFIGFYHGSVPSWISVLRVAFQAVTGAFPALIAMLCVGVQAGGFRWTQILDAQGANPVSWILVKNPAEPFACLIFIVSGLILFSEPPMDSGISRSETSGGLSSVWGGRNLVLFKFSRFYAFFLWSAMTVTLFFGGWLLPQWIQEALGVGAPLAVVETLTLLLKCFGLMLIIEAIIRVNPRTRADQITGLSWRVLSPLALIALMVSSLWKVYVV
jgi:NADH-quinone oxidoreductase subunit H